MVVDLLRKDNRKISRKVMAQARRAEAIGADYLS